MKFKIGDVVEIFETKEKAIVVNITEALISDIDPVTVDAYQLEGKRGVFVDAYDGTVVKT